MSRFFVPDLSPRDRPELRGGLAPRFVFVAESPHVSEITPERLEERRPLCGKAGVQWWSALSELLEGRASPDVSLEQFLRLCRQHRIAVLNAVQLPLDPKVAERFPDADPARTLGFSKAAGPIFYKKMKGRPELERAVQDLRARLDDPRLAGCPIYCLGLDAEWFVARALGAEGFAGRVRGRLAHPSAWWRRGGHFGRVARAGLEGIFSVPAPAPSSAPGPRAEPG